MTIVGVVEQARLDDVHQDGRPQLYIRTEDWGFRPLSFVVRTGTRSRVDHSGGSRGAASRRPARRRWATSARWTQIVADRLRQPRTSAGVIAASPWARCCSAAMGLFGIVAKAVTRRRHEMAVRLALGADHGRVLRLVVGEGAGLVGLGVLIGLPGHVRRRAA